MYFFNFTHRPPPKNIRRPAPVEPPLLPPSAAASIGRSNNTNSTNNNINNNNLNNSNNSNKEESSPINSFERNIKPSDILRFKSADSENKQHRQTIGEIKKSLPEEQQLGSYGKKVTKSESLKYSESPTGSLGKSISPTGSLEKSISARSTDSPTGSLGKILTRGNTSSLQSVASKESLASGSNISERVINRIEILFFKQFI